VKHGRLRRGAADSYVTRFWEDPMFDVLREVAVRLDGLAAFPDVATLDARLLAPLRDDPRHAFDHVLELQQPTPRRDSKRLPPKSLASFYDVRITDARRIPTRERSWHDVMNAIVFAAFPGTKTALHARQAAEVSRHFATSRKLPNARSRLQDVLALFDEGGVVLFGDTAAVARARPALLGGEGETLGAMVKERRLRAVVFGHAMLEHAILDAPLPRGAPILVEEDDAFGPEVRRRLDRALTRHVATLAGERGPPALDVTLLFEGTRAAQS
jgi:hypothetical protein